ncbi:flavodoxin [Bifidobacterium tissieri]|uniref:Flavodoxin n=1 Tax=Bifidobacterium tissieri TaxID=1630162 RepID=A0A5M9ZMW1_9BIFI|nr:flavodoxin [Bifidobacterium tissieri]KAA8827034.1 flavodoxin [Bifidobacterium tissieri]KAA8828769.1 flavodoxin [Bifidobacterium tissieri]
MQSVIVFFSRADENYEVGTVKEGNTAKVAHEIARQTGAPMIEILPSKPYPTSYDGTVDRAKLELAENARPDIVTHGDMEAFAAADIVYLGYPIWCGEPPLALYTFIESHDWNGKTILPFITHGGSGFKETPTHIVAAAGAGARIHEGLAVLGTTAQHDPEATAQAVRGWLSDNGTGCEAPTIRE